LCSSIVAILASNTYTCTRVCTPVRTYILVLQCTHTVYHHGTRVQYTCTYVRTYVRTYNRVRIISDKPKNTTTVPSSTTAMNYSSFLVTHVSHGTARSRSLPHHAAAAAFSSAPQSTSPSRTHVCMRSIIPMARRIFFERSFGPVALLCAVTLGALIKAVKRRMNERLLCCARTTTVRV
jgi:hypothetical protein